MAAEQKTLDKDRILSTPARRKLYQARMEGKSIKEAAKIAGIGYTYARDLCCGVAKGIVSNSGINALVKAEQAELSAEIGITVQSEQLALVNDIKAARKAKCWGAVMSGHNILMKSIGGFIADRPSPEGLTAKALDLAMVKEISAISTAWLEQRYNNKPIGPARAAEGIEGYTEPIGQPQARDAVFEADPPMPPNGPGPEERILPSHNTEDF